MRLSSPLLLASALALAACETPEPQVPPQGYPPGQLPPQGYAPGQPAPPQGYAPGQPPPPQGYAPQAYPPVEHDPINDVDLPWLRAAAKGVLDELIAALPPEAQAKVQSIPFDADATVGEVNAYASCDGQHMPHMAITDGLLQIEAYVAQVEAIDEVFGTKKLDAYLRYVAQNQKPHQPIVAPPASFIEPAQHGDFRKVVREHALFEEQLAFVLGHELGHHHLGHTGCAGGRGAPTILGTVLEAGRITTQVVPWLNQPNEAMADIAGVNNLLAAGARRGDRYHWTEAGAVLTLQFFAQLDDLHRVDGLSPEALLYTFEQSHPHPRDRLPGIQRAAADFRARGGVAVYPPALP
jgi:hypothetical protein